MLEPLSYYAATALPMPTTPRLEGDARADVCVVGAGYTGLSTALHLVEAGYRVVVLEAEQVGFGASGRNGGQLSGGQRRDVEWLEAHLGGTLAHALWALGDEARQLVKTRIAELAIDCDLTPGIAILAHRHRHVAEYHRLVDKLVRDYGQTNLEKIDAKRAADLLGTRAYHGGYVDWDAAHLHPLNLARGIAKHCLALGVAIHERTRATGFDDDAGKVRVRSTAGTVTADYLVLATNAYLDRLAPPLASHIMPINSFIVATEPLSPERLTRMNPRRVAGADSRFVVNYFRITGDRRLLFGGGENYRATFPRNIAGCVRPSLLKTFPHLDDLAIDYAWGGTLAITTNRMPHFGRLSPRVYFAQGFSGQGVALAHLAGHLIAQAIRGSAEKFDVFARIPVPKFPGGRLLRWPALVLGMTYFALRDRL